MYFGCFWKIENELVWPSLMFLTILAKHQWFSNNSDTLANLCMCYKHKTNFCLQVIELFKKSFVCTSCRLYLVLRSRLIEINFRVKTQQLPLQAGPGWHHPKSLPFFVRALPLCVWGQALSLTLFPFDLTVWPVWSYPPSTWISTRKVGKFKLWEFDITLLFLRVLPL